MLKDVCSKGTLLVRDASDDTEWNVMLTKHLICQKMSGRLSKPHHSSTLTFIASFLPSLIKSIEKIGPRNGRFDFKRLTILEKGWLSHIKQKRTSNWDRLMDNFTGNITGEGTLGARRHRKVIRNMSLVEVPCRKEDAYANGYAWVLVLKWKQWLWHILFWGLNTIVRLTNNPIL